MKKSWKSGKLPAWNDWAGLIMHQDLEYRLWALILLPPKIQVLEPICMM